MSFNNKALFGIIALLASSLVSAADEQPKWITEGPYVDEGPISFEIPMEVLANKLFIEVEVGGVTRRFLFDTGSPSMMSESLAAELKLEAIDKRQGRDSHGAIVETDVVQADLTLGGTTFHKVPVFVADFPKTAQCLFDGVLGSEVLPLCSWQIDLPDSVLRCSSTPETLDHVEKAEKLRLYDFGYPHAPIVDVQLADNASSKAMLDTGSPEYMAISPPDFEGARRNDGVGKMVEGNGSIGGSIGGAAPDKRQLMMRLESLGIGNVQLGEVDALLRESSPSLIGTAVLEHYVVTLDSKNATAYFDQYRDAPFVRSSYGFGMNFEDAMSVSLVWNDSPAAAAGLRPGRQVKSINGEPVEASCGGLRKTMHAISAGDTLDIEWEGGKATLNREAAIPD